MVVPLMTTRRVSAPGMPTGKGTELVVCEASSVQSFPPKMANCLVVTTTLGPSAFTLSGRRGQDEFPHVVTTS